MMETKKIPEMSNEELDAEVSALTKELFNFRFQQATGQVAAPSKIRAARKQIARLKTARRARQLKAGGSPA